MKKLKRLYRSNWIIRFAVNFFALYLLFAILIVLIRFVFGAVNTITTLMIVFLLCLGVTGFLRGLDKKKDKYDR